MISSQDFDAISQFSSKFIVPEEEVTEFIKHLENLKFEKEKRLITAQQEKQGISEQTYEEINWSDLFENNLLDKQTVATLDKYIDHHKLGAYQYKTEKVQALKRHIATTIVLGDDKDQSSDDDDDIVITACDTSTSESSDGSDDNDASDEDLSPSSSE